jgi:hypothetical protein
MCLFSLLLGLNRMHLSCLPSSSMWMQLRGHGIRERQRAKAELRNQLYVSVGRRPSSLFVHTILSLENKTMLESRLQSLQVCPYTPFNSTFDFCLAFALLQATGTANSRRSPHCRYIQNHTQCSLSNHCLRIDPNEPPCMCLCSQWKTSSRLSVSAPC